MAFSPLNALAVTPTDTARENKIYLYFFIGWYSEGKTYSAGEAVEITRDRSFAAVWDENQYFIEYYSNFTPRYEQDDAGVRDEKMKIVSCGFYDEVTILDNPFEHPDETARFIGWSLERTGKPVYKPGDVVQGLSDEWYGVVRLYARWNFPEEIITPPPEVVMSAALTPGTVKHYAYDLAGNRTDFLLDGGNVAAEQTDGDITAYLRGVNLIARSERRHDGILPLQRPWGCGAADGRGRRSHQDLCLRRLRRGERPGFRRSEPLPLLRGVF